MSSKKKISLTTLPQLPPAPAKPDEDALRAFIAQSPAPSPTPAPPAPTAPKRTAQIMVYLSDEEARRIKVHCTENGIKFTDFMREAAFKMLDG
jgi:hypothetical protein